jgi:hypothetical protein
MPILSCLERDIDSPTNSFHEFKLEPDDELVEALRNNGYTVDFRQR